MAEMTPRERVRCVLAGDIPDRVPYVEVGIDYPWICKLLDRPLTPDEHYDSGEYRTNSLEDQFRINELLHRDVVAYCCLPPIPAIRIPGEHQLLFFHDGKIKTRDDVEALELPDVTGEEFKQQLREFVADSGEYATVAQARCGISATYLAMGMERFFLMLMDDPDTVERLMCRYAEWTANLIPALDEAGFDVVMTGDDIAIKNGLLISAELLGERFWPHVRKIADAIKGSRLKWAYHSDGDLTAVLDDLVALGIDILHPIEPGCMNIVALKDRFRGHPVICGNVDVDLLARGTADEVKEAVLFLLDRVAPGGGYFLSSGNSVTGYAKVENVLAMCETNCQYGHYPLKPGALSCSTTGPKSK